MKIKKRFTRIVFVFDCIVIKIPNFLYGHQNFLRGCLENWSERKFTKDYKDFDYYSYKICPVLFSTWFGLLSIQPKAEVLKRELTDEEIKYFKYIVSEPKLANFGYYDGRLVCLDYA